MKYKYMRELYDWIKDQSNLDAELKAYHLTYLQYEMRKRTRESMFKQELKQKVRDVFVKVIQGDAVKEMILDELEVNDLELGLIEDELLEDFLDEVGVKL